jgi:hypothetical protein
MSAVTDTNPKGAGRPKGSPNRSHKKQPVTPPPELRQPEFSISYDALQLALCHDAVQSIITRLPRLAVADQEAVAVKLVTAVQEQRAAAHRAQCAKVLERITQCLHQPNQGGLVMGVDWAAPGAEATDSVTVQDTPTEEASTADTGGIASE